MLLDQASYGLIERRLVEPDAPFLLSFGFDLAKLKISIEQTGIASPLIVRENEGTFTLVCGYKRLLVAEELGSLKVPAWILPAGISDKQILKLVLEENLGHRKLNPLETIMAVKYLSTHFSAEDIISNFMVKLNLPPKQVVLDRYLKLSELEDLALAAIAVNSMDAETGETLLLFAKEDREAILNLFDRHISPNANKRRQTVTWLYEIFRRDDIAAASIINNSEMQTIIMDENLSRPDKESQVRALIYKLRFPTVSQMEEKQAELLSALKLPKKVRLSPPSSFEGLDFTINMSFENLKELDDLRTALDELADNPIIKELIELG